MLKYLSFHNSSSFALRYFFFVKWQGPHLVLAIAIPYESPQSPYEPSDAPKRAKKCSLTTWSVGTWALFTLCNSPWSGELLK